MRALPVLFAAALLASPAYAEGRFMPTASCEQAKGFADPQEQAAMERYLVYLASAVFKKNLPDTPAVRKTILQQMQKACTQMPSGSGFEDVAIAMVKLVMERTAPDLKTSAHTLLKQFTDPTVDKAALTQSLRPTSEDIAIIFKPSLAAKIEDYVSKVFGAGSIEPKPSYTEVLVTVASTSDLIDAGPALREFPGGYKRLRPHLRRNIPIVRFKFVEPGETLGLAFDGLYWVNDRWVLVPKGWRVVEE